MLGKAEQPNLPGTVTEHPNWRRRLAAPMAELFASEAVTRRCALLQAARGGQEDPAADSVSP
jgi:4-alpha-glucanotransferase